MHAENNFLQLLRCTSGQGVGPCVGWRMPIYLCTEVLRIERALEKSLKALLTYRRNDAEGFTFVISTYL